MDIARLFPSRRTRDTCLSGSLRLVPSPLFPLPHTFCCSLITVRVNPMVIIRTPTQSLLPSETDRSLVSLPLLGTRLTPSARREARASPTPPSPYPPPLSVPPSPPSSQAPVGSRARSVREAERGSRRGASPSGRGSGRRSICEPEAIGWQADGGRRRSEAIRGESKANEGSRGKEGEGRAEEGG